YIRQVFGAETLAYERRRLDGERLGRVGRFTRNVAGRDRPFDDLEQRLTGSALKQESKAGLGNLRDRVHRFALAEDGHQRWLRRNIVIPEIVMNGLKVPDPLAGKRLHGHQRIAEKARTLAVPSVIIVGRRSQRQKRNSPLYIHGGNGPHVCATPAPG